jgi:hypothetical protein
MSTKTESAAEKSEVVTRPTYAPAAIAMGVMMLAWGILIHWTLSAFGAGLFVWALWKWMNEVCHEWRAGDES